MWVKCSDAYLASELLIWSEMERMSAQSSTLDGEVAFSAHDECGEGRERGGRRTNVGVEHGA